MPRINLKDFYDWCKEDEFVEVTDEMLEIMKAADRHEAAVCTAIMDRVHKEASAQNDIDWL